MKAQLFNTQSILILFVSFFSVGFTTANSSQLDPARFDLSELRFSEFKCSLNGYSKSILFVAQAEQTEYYFRQNGIGIANRDQLDSNAAKNLIRNGYSEHKVSRQSVELVWDGINSQVEISGAERLRTRNTSFAQGIDCKEKTYRKLYYNQLYPGIDLMYKDRADQLEFDLEVQAGFNYNQINFHFEGAESLHMDELGRLIIESAAGKYYLDRLIAHQDGKPLLASWSLNGNHISVVVEKVNASKSVRFQTVMQTVKSQI